MLNKILRACNQLRRVIDELLSSVWITENYLTNMCLGYLQEELEI